MILTLRMQLILTTLSIALVVIAVLLVTLTVFGSPLISQPIVRSMGDATAAIERLAAGAPKNEPIDVLVRRIVANADAHGVNVAIIPPSEVGTIPSMDAGPMDLARLLGIRGETVPVRDDLVIVFPQPRRIDAAIRSYLILVSGGIVFSLVLSFFVARWVARLAVAPLLAVTRELERFATGDFRKRTLQTSDRGELGALTAAFNDAADQVARSFDERARVEQLMRQFVADASHELRTPLTIIGGFVDVLARGGYANDDVRENAFKRMKTEQARMRHLVDRLILLARIERPQAGAPELVDVAEVTRDAIAARAGVVAVPLRAPAGAIYVRADPSDVFEAVANLVENAAKYGTQPAVSIEREPIAAVIRVSDTGPGIESTDVERIFERFYRSERARGIVGSGLGLTIATSAAARAGGTLVLENTGAGTTTFALRLPLITTDETV